MIRHNDEEMAVSQAVFNVAHDAVFVVDALRRRVVDANATAVKVRREMEAMFGRPNVA